MATGIEWTDGSLPVPPYMAAFTEGHHIKPMRTSITKMVVILVGRAATIPTRQLCRPGHATAFNLIADGATRLALHLCRRGPALAASPNLDAATWNTGGGESIAPASIEIEMISRFPALAAIAPFQPLIALGDIGLKRNPNTTRRQFHNANLRSHTALLDFEWA